MNPDLDKSRNYANWEKVSLLGVKIDALSLEQLLSEIRSCIIYENKVVISYVNIHAINIAYSTRWFRDFLNQSYLTFCDGVGIKVAAGLIGQSIYFRFTPPDFIECLVQHAYKSGWKIFFLGARSGVAQRAAKMLMTKYPGLQMETHHGYFDKTMGSKDNDKVVAQINSFRPQILILGFGMPLQERWILENLAELQINIAFPAGALFDYVAGEVRRAPRWMTDHGLEWFGRLIVEPRRLWKRYLIGNPMFFWRVFIYHILKIPLTN